jgi:hypothetical protein
MKKENRINASEMQGMREGVFQATEPIATLQQKKTMCTSV